MFVVRSGIPGDIILRLAEEDRAELVAAWLHCLRRAEPRAIARAGASGWSGLDRRQKDGARVRRLVRRLTSSGHSGRGRPNHQLRLIRTPARQAPARLTRRRRGRR
jgi:hypothetical protein